MHQFYVLYISIFRLQHVFLNIIDQNHLYFLEVSLYCIFTVLFTLHLMLVTYRHAIFTDEEADVMRQSTTISKFSLVIATSSNVRSLKWRRSAVLTLLEVCLYVPCSTFSYLDPCTTYCPQQPTRTIQREQWRAYLCCEQGRRKSVPASQRNWHSLRKFGVRVQTFIGLQRFCSAFHLSN